MALARTGPRVSQITGNGRVGDTTDDTVRRKILGSGVLGRNLEAAHYLQLVLVIGKVRVEGQLVTGRELEVLLLVVRSKVRTA